jgi:uncharacterized membrane protein (UPF0127 family)
VTGRSTTPIVVGGRVDVTADPPRRPFPLPPGLASGSRRETIRPMSRLRVDRTCGAPRALRDASGRVVVARCYRASTWWGRLVGLLGTPDLGGDEALWLEPCRSVHTWGMRTAIDIAFLDDAGRVLAVHASVRAGRALRHRGGRVVLEAAPGAFADLETGMVLHRREDE